MRAVGDVITSFLSATWCDAMVMAWIIAPKLEDRRPNIAVVIRTARVAAGKLRL